MKTADDMFRQLKYRKAEEDRLTIVYEKIDASADAPYNGCLAFNYKEILACAQLLKEMRGSE